MRPTKSHDWALSCKHGGLSKVWLTKSYSTDNCRAQVGGFKTNFRKPAGCKICHKINHTKAECRARCGNCGGTGDKTKLCKKPRRQNGEFRVPVKQDYPSQINNLVKNRILTL